MYLKDELEQLAKENAFEYDLHWWNEQKIKGATDRITGNIVAFYKGRSIFNGVVALWGRDKRSAVLFYTTPHDVEDERKYGWVPPVFRVETNQQNCFRLPADPRPANPFAEEPEVDFPLPPERGLWREALRGRPLFMDQINPIEQPVDPIPVDEEELVNQMVREELFGDANRR